MEDLKEVKKEDWDRFVVEHGGSFLQSYEWGEFQRSIGREVFYLKDINFQALVIKYRMPLGRNYLFCPQGPIIKNFQFPNPNFQSNSNPQCQNIDKFLDEIKKLAAREKSVFMRIEPCDYSLKDELQELKCIKSKDIQPHKTLVLDLGLSEEELLAQMHEKTRYNIGLASRKGVEIKKEEYNEGDFNAFWHLLNQTAKRQKIRLFSKEYYKKQLTVKSGEYKNWLFIARYEGRPIAANMVNIFGKTAVYLHGGSDNDHRALMAPHLLQWEQIKFAKSAGCKIYDFWGCDDEKWPGISRFKKGFGGREIESCGTHDYVFDKWWYRIYKVGRGILR